MTKGTGKPVRAGGDRGSEGGGCRRRMEGLARPRTSCASLKGSGRDRRHTDINQSLLLRSPSIWCSAPLTGAVARVDRVERVGRIGSSFTFTPAAAAAADRFSFPAAAREVAEASFEESGCAPSPSLPSSSFSLPWPGCC